MNWALWMLQMISLIGYEDRGRVATPELFSKGIVSTESNSCTISPIHEIEEFNQQLLDFTAIFVNYRSFGLRDYPHLLQHAKSMRDMGLYHGYAELAGEWKSGSYIFVRCTEDTAIFKTIFEMEEINIKYRYWCYGEEGNLTASIPTPKMIIVLLQARNSNDSYTYGSQYAPVIPIDYYIDPEPQMPECRQYFDSVKHDIAYEAYQACYYGIKKWMDFSGFDLKQIVKWDMP